MNLDCRLRDAALADAPVPWRRATVPADLAPGRLELRAGLYNSRTRRRFAVHPAEDLDTDRRRRTFLAATIDVLPGPAEAGEDAVRPVTGGRT